MRSASRGHPYWAWICRIFEILNSVLEVLKDALMSSLPGVSGFPEEIGYLGEGPSDPEKLILSKKDQAFIYGVIS